LVAGSTCGFFDGGLDNIDNEFDALSPSTTSFRENARWPRRRP
jgi:hypothetical protein